MAQPRRRYEGCLASRLQPEDYEHCLDNYDDPKFENLSLVPSSLKQRVHDRGNEQIKDLLAPSLTRKGKTTSDLPAGYRQYISKHPDEFKNYFEQRRHELGLLKAVLRNLSNEDKRRLQEYYAEHKTIEPEKFSEIIRTLPNGSKRQREMTIGGSSKGRFDLDERAFLYDSDQRDQSLADMFN
jgi:hypothetical protein